MQRGALLCRIGDRLCAIPVTHVVETMRPLAIEPFASAPAFVRGTTIVRGRPMPVVDAARLLGAESPIGRFVSLKVGVVLAVEDVVGIRDIPSETQRDLPPLLRDARADVIETIGARDAELLVVLRTMQLVPSEGLA